MPAFYAPQGAARWWLQMFGSRPWSTLPAPADLFSFRIRDGFCVVFGEIGGHRKFPCLQVIDAVPVLDPRALYVLTLHVKRQADHDIAAVGPMLPHPGVVILHSLDQCDKGVIERVGVLGVAVHAL